MNHIKTYDYAGKKVDIYQVEQSDSVVQLSVPTYRVVVDGQDISDDHSFSMATPEVLEQDINEWIDNNP